MLAVILIAMVSVLAAWIVVSRVRAHRHAERRKERSDRQRRRVQYWAFVTSLLGKDKPKRIAYIPVEDRHPPQG